MSTMERRTTYREVFAVPAFRVLFASRTLAVTAGTLRIVALSLLVYAVTGSTLLSAVAFGVGFVPQLLGGVLLGSLADRYRPRPLLVTGFLVECGVAAVLAVPGLPVASSLGIVAVAALVTPVFNGASSRLVAQVLTGDAYVLGRSVSSMAAAAAQVAGTAFGGVAVAAVGPRPALLIGAGCQLVAAATVRLGLPDLVAPARSTPTTSVTRDSWTVTVALLRDTAVRRLLLIQWLPPAFLTGVEAVVVPYAAGRAFPAGTVGGLLACVPAGMLVADLVVGRFLRPSTRERLVPVLLVLGGLPLFGLLADPSVRVVALLLAVAGGGGSAYVLGVQRRFVDALPEAHRGQGFGLAGMGLMTVQGLGPVAIGGLGQATSPPVAMAAAGGLIVLTAIAWTVSRSGWSRSPSPYALPDRRSA